jgi:hypothetical protein
MPAPAPEPDTLPADVWCSDTSIAEVVHYASKELSLELLIFAAATRRKNNGEMLGTISALRHVITRMDQYRRMKVKQWNAAASATPKQETPAT